MNLDKAIYEFDVNEMYEAVSKLKNLWDDRVRQKKRMKNDSSTKAYEYYAKIQENYVDTLKKVYDISKAFVEEYSK